MEDMCKLKIPSDVENTYFTPKMRSIYINVSTKEDPANNRTKYLSSIISYEIDLDSDKASTTLDGNTKFFSIFPFH
jgi:hypothetical protein